MNRDPNNSSNLVVVGAGAAGLMAAVSAARSGVGRVIVLEHLPEAGMKLLETGGGRCNFTNILATDDFIRRFGDKSRFVAPALRAMGGNRLRLFFEELGVPSRSSDGFHVFPVFDSARSVRDALLRECRKLGVEMRFNIHGRGFQIEQGRVAGIITSAGKEPASRVVLAAGGASYPKLGGGESGFSLAKNAGHTIVPLCPALAPLVTRATWPATLAGVTFPRTRIALKDSPRVAAAGSLLFTHKGISGPAVLDISGHIASALTTRESVAVTIDLSPDRTIGEWQRELEAGREKHGAKTALSLLGLSLPAALAKIALDLASISAGAKAAHLSRAQSRRLIASIKQLPLNIRGTEGFGKAMVTRGGVKLDEVNPKTLESRIARGLFFAGEILDVDGPCGGFNLHWAFASGFLAGQHATRAGRLARTK